jgi:phosphatidate cytidylyltransferase
VLSRIFSTLVLWGILLGSLYLFGSHAAVALVTLLSALTLYEFYDLTVKMGAKPFRWMGIGFSVVMTAGPYLSLALMDEDAHGYAYISAALISLAVVFVALLVTCVRVLGERDGSNRIETIAATVMGLVYVPFTLQFLVLILMFDATSTENLVLCLWVIAVSKFCDVGALLTGLAIGRHKMSPVISPKKTWEGVIGGVLTSAGIGAGIAFFASGQLPEELTPLTAALVAVSLAIVTITSDLIESVLKRRADSKDSGRLIPGIGGALDLADSLLFAGPVAYFIFIFLFW